jgi:hypothetical protein
MPVDLTDLLENVSAPPMHVDVDTVLSRGRRRRLRRRLYGTAAVLGAAALILPAAAALRGDSAPSPVAAISPPGDCLFASPDPGGPPAGAFASLELTGTPWLDSGSSDAGRSVRVQVNTDTCQGLAVMVRRGSGGGVSTFDTKGRLEHAFWVVDTVGGGVDRFGKVLPVKSLAVVLLPEGQQVCGIAAGPEAEPPKGSSPYLTEPVTTPAGRGWQATFASMSSMGNAQGATLRICEGTRVVEPALRPLNAITNPEPAPTGSAVTYYLTQPDGTTVVRDGNGTILDEVTCPGANVNSGTADSLDTSAVADVRDHATTWAKATGLLKRFPGAALSVDENERTATATFVDQDATRAELTYRQRGDGWTLEQLSYC